MNQQLTVDREHWLTINPAIEFRKVKKAFYGTHLLKVKLYVCGASMRYNQYIDYSITPENRTKNPDYNQFMTFLKSHVQRFNMQKLTKIDENRYVHVTRKFRLDAFSDNKEGREHRIYDASSLYILYNMLKKKPDGIRFAREYNTLHVYGNNINDIEEVINQLKIPSQNIISITSPDDQDVAALLSGKEFSIKADRFKYKVFLKPATDAGIPALANYLESIKDTGEVEVPRHCRLAITGPTERWSWAFIQRSYLYAKNEDTILLIKLLAGNRYSTCLELMMVEDETDK